MIRGVHTMFYSSQAEELCTFLRDKLNLASTDVGDGWSIFGLPGGVEMMLFQPKYGKKARDRS